MGTPNKLTEAVRVDIINRWQAGEPISSIAEALDLNRNTVARFLHHQFPLNLPGTSEFGARMSLQRPTQPVTPAEAVVYPKNPPKRTEWSDIERAEAARFWLKLTPPIKPKGCRRWFFSHDTHGYGQFSSHISVSEKAHRVAWRLTYGPIPEGLAVLHRCDVGDCCEPTHLWLGTQQQNMADMAAKGRHGMLGREGQKGEDNVTAKLTWDVVNEMRRLREKQGWTYDMLVEKFGISKSQVCNICLYKQWKPES